DFVSGIQYLINQKIMKIPSTTLGSSTGTNMIPKWIKTTAGFWANGQITDQDFVSGIQYLITSGILKIK
ncbi:MAG: peptidase, partial [Nitrosopumilaceae archaeon]